MILKIEIKKILFRKHNQRIEYQKNYNKQNQSKINLYRNNRKETDLNFKLACNIRSRTSEAFKAQNIKKTNKTIDLLGCSREFFKKWILHQLYGEMTKENYGLVWVLDHCFPLSKTNLSNQNEMIKSIYWINSRPMYCGEDISKGSKIDHHLYLLQQIKAKYFLKLNEEEHNENFHL